MAGIAASTRALEGSDADYARIEGKIGQLTVRRNTVADQIAPALDDATFAGTPIPAATARSMIAQAQAIIRDARRLARSG